MIEVVVFVFCYCLVGLLVVSGLTALNYRYNEWFNRHEMTMVTDLEIRATIGLTWPAVPLYILTIGFMACAFRTAKKIDALVKARMS